jgi:hemoglobin/transferrin/lactoferrin receptor protein
VTFHADYFHTRISDYIAQTLVTGAPDPTSFIPIPIEGYFYQNTPGTTVTQGYELEASYVSKILFANIAYTNTLTKLPQPDYTGFDQIVTAPPRSVFAATLGVHLLDGKLTLGERTRAASATTGQPSAETGVATSVPGYVVEDLFTSYQVSENIRFSASIENIGNRQYFTDALASVPSPGLTAKFGITVALGR